MSLGPQHFITQQPGTSSRHCFCCFCWTKIPLRVFPNLDVMCIVIDDVTLLAAMCDRHRSHFGSRYTLGCCDIASLFAWCDIAFAACDSLAEAKGPWATSKMGPIAAPTWTGTPKEQELPTALDVGYLSRAPQGVCGPHREDLGISCLRPPGGGNSLKHIWRLLANI